VMGLIPTWMCIPAVLALAGWLLSWCWTFARAVGALYHLTGVRHSSLRFLLYDFERSEDNYPHPGSGNLPFRIYRPRSRKIPPAMIIYHGASAYGEAHPALDNMASALARAGYQVFLPRLPRLKQVLIDEANIQSMLAFYNFLLEYPGVPPARISMMGISFAGGLMLKALLDSRLQEAPPRAILAYGTYCDQERALRFAITGQASWEGVEVVVQQDNWGQIIFFHNFLADVPGDFDRAALADIFRCYVTNQAAKGDELRAQLPTAERRMAGLMVTPGHPETMDLVEAMLQKVQSKIAAASPARFYREIPYPIWVFHGRHDAAVPYTEALALKALMGRQVRLHISDLYSHKEIDLDKSLWQTSRDVVAMVLFMGRFFRAAESRW